MPLTQTTELTKQGECSYFVRFKQSSNTNQYVGGTAESIWAYCDGETSSVPITSDWVGTSKSPQVYKGEHLLYLSDYTEEGAGLMNIFATPLLAKSHLYPNNGALTKTIKKLTSRCETLMPIMEYSIDQKTNDIVFRSGADLFYISASSIEASLSSGSPVQPVKIELLIQSDFSQTHEHLVEVDLIKHVTTVDIVKTPFGQVNAVLTVRGQAWVAPAAETPSSPPPPPPLQVRRRTRGSSPKEVPPCTRVHERWFHARHGGQGYKLYALTHAGD